MLEYVRRDARGAWQFDAYFAYLDSVRSRLSESTYRFAAAQEHYSLDSPSSLHDAWLEQLVIAEGSSGARSDVRHTELTLRLLGPMHDRIHVLTYAGVRSYQISSGRADHGFGDLLVHEVRLSDRGAVIHELLFASGATLLVECQDLAYTHEPREPRTGTA